MEWTHTQTIDAPPETVWELATNVTAWPTFMPTMQSVDRLEEGPLRLGSRAVIKQPAQRKALWTVIELTPGRTFSWVSQRRGMAMTGSHLVEPEGAGTRSTLTLAMSGPLAPVLGPLLGAVMRRVLRTENACFAERAMRQPQQGTHAR